MRNDAYLIEDMINENMLVIIYIRSNKPHKRGDTFMGLANIGVPGLILIIVLALIIFGPKKLPDIGRAAGQTLREFKTSANDLMSDDDEFTKRTEESTESLEEKS